VIVLLTADHFHYAGLALPLLLGLAGRARGGLPRGLVGLVLVSVAAVAVGITATRLLDRPTLVELGAAWVMAAAGAGVAALQLAELLRPGPLLPRVLLALSGLALLLGMGFAAAYAWASSFGRPEPSIATMLAWHGAVNAFGFALPALVARTLAPPPAPDPPAGPPFSGLSGGGFRIGPDWLDRRGLVPAGAGPVRGLVDRLEDLAAPGLDLSAVDPDVRAFYEDPDAWTFFVRARWRRAFALPGRVWVALARRIGQLVLPLDRGGAWQEVRSRVGPIDRARDGRPDARASVRTYADGGAMYVATYATHAAAGVRYMNIGLPLPGGGLASVLRMASRGDGGIVLTSRPTPGAAPGDEGLWLVTALGPVRVPLHERLELAPLEAAPDLVPEPRPEGARVVARHTFTLLGLTVLVLDYGLVPVDAERARSGA